MEGGLLALRSHTQTSSNRPKNTKIQTHFKIQKRNTAKHSEAAAVISEMGGGLVASSTPRGLTHKTPQWDQQLIIFSLSFGVMAFLSIWPPFSFLCVVCGYVNVSIQTNNMK